jgi:hypothetical protein
MKTLFTITMPLLILMTSIVSCKLFQEANYYVSALLTMTCFLAAILWVEILSHRKITLE